jgi:glutamine amidotransferase
MGWNNVEGDNFFKNCNQKKFYFAHSYHVVCEENIIVAKCNYGKEIPAYIKKNNVHGIQFHPEKSHKNGMQLLKNLTKSNF